MPSTKEGVDLLIQKASMLSCSLFVPL